jgi:hypothetical protein
MKNWIRSFSEYLNESSEMESLKGKIPNEKLEALKRLGFYEETPPRVSETEICF